MLKKSRFILVILLLLIFICIIAGFITKNFIYKLNLMTAQTQVAVITSNIMRGLKAYEENNSEYPSNIKNILSEYIKEAPPLILKSKDGMLINNWNKPIIIKYENQKNILLLKVISKIKKNELIYDMKYDKNKKQWISVGVGEQRVKGEDKY